MKGWLALLWVLAVTGSAQAYCRTTTCTDCARDPETGCAVEGMPLAFAQRCISFSMEETAASSVDYETARSLMQRAFALWQAAECTPDGQHPSFEISDPFGAARCPHPDYDASGANANVVMFREDWPYQDAGHSLAATRVKFDPESGAILDVDMEINAGLSLLTESPSDGMSAAQKGIVPGGYDLLSIMTHEAGHFLGLDHSRAKGAVMRPALSELEVVTTLSEDDVAAICAAYPPRRQTAPCDPTPRGGFSATCASGGDVTGVGCALHPTGGAPSSWTLALVAGLWTWLRRARGRRVSIAGAPVAPTLREFRTPPEPLATIDS